MQEKLTKGTCKRKPTEEQLAFGKRIAETRRQKGFSSQTAFAEAVGISSPSLAYYETASRKPDYEIFAKMADVLDVSYDFLLGRTESQPRENINIFERLGLSDQAIKEIERIRSFGMVDISKILNLICTPGYCDTIFDNLNNFFDLKTCIQLQQSIENEVLTASNTDTSLIFLTSITAALFEMRKKLFASEKEAYLKNQERGNGNGDD